MLIRAWRAMLPTMTALAASTCAAALPPALPTSQPPASTTATAPVPRREAAAPALPRGTVRIDLERVFDGTDVVSFGLPLKEGVAKSTSAIGVYSGTTRVAADIRPLLSHLDANGNPASLRSVLIQFPAALMPGRTMTLGISFDETGAEPPSAGTPFIAVSADSAETASVTDRTVVKEGSAYRWQENNTRQVTVFAGREPAVQAHFPAGYLAHTGILGPQVTAAELAGNANFAGLKFLSDEMAIFTRSAIYEEGYALNPAAILDPVTNYEGWLYDRCATLLTAYSHFGEPGMRRHALRACSYYGGKINTGNTGRGLFSVRLDMKYSHARGLYAYYALTGDETALAALTAMADMWAGEPTFVVPYRAGAIRGPDKLWTERLLGTSLEGLYYGYRATGNARYLVGFKELFNTAYRHITTTDQAELAAINRDANRPPFPPQNCWVHNSVQAADGSYKLEEPFCSGWMSELVIDSLLSYQAQTGDPRVDEVFIRLARFLRDTGSEYHSDTVHDHFLEPARCYDASQGERTRRLVPIYGSGLRANGQRAYNGEYDDLEHCTDATALTAAAIRALKRQGKYDQGGPFGPFPSEGASFLAMHHEFAACAKTQFQTWHRTNRDPRSFASAALAQAAADPATFIQKNLVGHSSFPSSPQRKLSWWFNTSMLQFGLLQEAGVTVPALRPGAIQPAGQNCPAR